MAEPTIQEAELKTRRLYRTALVGGPMLIAGVIAAARASDANADCRKRYNGRLCSDSQTPLGAALLTATVVGVLTGILAFLIEAPVSNAEARTEAEQALPSMP